MPRVSVIMGVYNGEYRLRKAVESIIGQTFGDFEFIICDDCSTDNSYAVLEKLRRKDDRIILMKNDVNMGLAHTLNNCLKVAEGEYIARMDDDDYSHPARFEKQVNFLDKHDKYAIVGTAVNMYDESGVWGKRVIGDEVSPLSIYKGHTFVHPSVMMRRSAVSSVNNYSVDKRIGRTEDLDLWVKLYYAGYIGYNLKDVLLDYYEGKSSYKKRKYKYRIDEYKIKKKARKLLNIPAKYAIFEFKPLIIGLIPGRLIKWYHSKKFNQI